MAILKCKMCGGDLNVTADEKIVECEFCGTTQTIPEVSDEKKTNLFNRANRLRIANEFDKASGIYEGIIAEFPDEAESYWGLCLCKFGIEYVDDPKTARKIPTCHRTSFDSIFDDENYKMAIEKSDVIAQGVYKEEATVIDNLQKDILSIVHKEEPFDVFICYKETDELGQRTQDSVLAQDIYDALTDKGFKVFFSRITLEDKLGKQYEPYIFAALNSAKVMLAIGTKEEYYNAVWVKNEWSRYLALMESDKSKMLIPCYRDIDPYDMPQEFKNLQGQDMSKLGFLQDLVRGITKMISPKQEKQVQTEAAAPTAANATVDSLLKRAFMFLEDGNWDSANEYCEKVLDIDPECAEAYLGKLMAELQVKKAEDLKNCQKPFDDNNNYQKAIRFADEKTKNELLTYNEESKKESKRIEKERLNRILKGQEKAQIRNCQMPISVAGRCKIGLKSDGTVVADGHIYNQGPFDVKNWTDIVAVYAGNNHALGLKSDGTVVAVGDNESGQCNVENWTDIVAISTSDSLFGNYTVGLKSDGTVVAVGDNRFDQLDVEKWTDIVAVSATVNHTVGLKSDGTVVAVGNNNDGQCNVKDWKDIVTISTGSPHTAGLKSNGTVVAVGNNYYGQCNVGNWTDIVMISTGWEHTIGLKLDGTVVAVGNNKDGQCNVKKWTDIVAVSAGMTHTVGLKSDGTVVAVGDNESGQCNVENWTDIVAVFAGSSCTVGLKADGTTVVSMWDAFYDIELWSDIAVPILAETKEEYESEMQKVIERRIKKKDYIKKHVEKIDELKAEYQKQYPLGEKKESLQHEKKLKENVRGWAIEERRKALGAIQQNLIAFVCCSAVSIVGVVALIAIISAGGFSDAVGLNMFMLILVGLLIIGVKIFWNELKTNKEKEKSLKTKYDELCETISLFEKQIAEADRAPSFEKFCKEKGFDLNVNYDKESTY